MHEDSKDTLAGVIDEMENFRLSLETMQSPLAALAFKAMKQQLPKWLDELKAVHLVEHGENKWAR